MFHSIPNCMPSFFNTSSIQRATNGNSGALEFLHDFDIFGGCFVSGMRIKNYQSNVKSLLVQKVQKSKKDVDMTVQS